MSEPWRANHEYGALSFLATQWRALVGAGALATGFGLLGTWMERQ